MITEAGQASDIIRKGEADLVLLAREMLRNPYWGTRFRAIQRGNCVLAVQYLRAAPHGSTARYPSPHYLMSSITDTTSNFEIYIDVFGNFSVEFVY